MPHIKHKKEEIENDEAVMRMRREIRAFAPKIFGESDVRQALPQYFYSEGLVAGLDAYLEGQLSIIKYQLEK